MPEALVRASLVIVAEKLAKDTLEVIGSEDENVVQKLPSHRAHPNVRRRRWPAEPGRAAGIPQRLLRKTVEGCANFESRSRSRNLAASARCWSRQARLRLLHHPVRRLDLALED